MISTTTSIDHPFQPFDQDAIEHSIPLRFREQVAKYGTNVAVLTTEQSVSYAELESFSNRIASALLDRSDATNEPVALLLSDPVSMIAAILGVLSAGKVYLPLNTDFTPQRCETLWRESGAKILIAAAHTMDRARQLIDNDATILDIDVVLRQFSRSAPNILVGPDHGASIVYTSGTTGVPRGVFKNHRNLLNHVRNHTNSAHFAVGDRLSLLTPFTASASETNLFGALLNGATICPLHVKHSSAAEIVDWLDQQRITVYYSVPTLFRRVMSAKPEDRKLPHLRLVRLGGESVLASDVELYRRHFKHGCVLNVSYGISEAVNVSQYFLDEHTPISDDIVPVGYPHANVELLVTDAKGDPVPVGHAGEIVVKSRYLGPGYWRQPELNARTFVTDPTDPDGPRTFRTGDLGRLLPSGCLVHLGRMNDMVKIRGQRVELAEVRAKLLSLTVVNNAVIVARPDHLGETRLIAYVEANRDSQVSISELRSALARELADHLVPSAFVFLDALPTMSNGKIDYQALPEPGRQRPALTGDLVPPRTHLEHRMSALWAELLGIEEVGIHDNFFDLGGHSLIAVQLITSIRDRFGMELPLRSLFESPTVAELIREIKRRQDNQSAQPGAVFSLPHVVGAFRNRYEPFPLTEIQQAYWVGRFGDFELGNVPTHGYREFESRDLNLERLEAAWRKLVERHDMLRAVVTADGRQQVLEHVPPFQIEVLDLTEQPADRVESELTVVRQQMSSSVKRVDRWPLFEIRATRLANGRLRVHLTLDVLIADLWSRMILFREWEQLYHNLDALLPPLELSYRDYVMTMLKLRDAEVYRRSQRYWRERSATLPAAPQLPLAQSPAALARPSFLSWSAGLDGPTWARLKQHVRRTGLTSSGLLLTAFAEVLRVCSKSPQFTINLTHFQRLPVHPRVNDVVGDFTSLILFQVDAARENDTFEQRALQMQQRLWNDLDHAHVSGVEVMRELARQTGSTPRATMPVVFTSVLPHTAGESSPAHSGNWLGRQVHHLSQTPQVWLDLVVREENGELVLNWNFVQTLFPDGMMRQMFDSYQRYLKSLANEPRVWQETWPSTVQRLAPRARLDHERPNSNSAVGPDGLLHTRFLQRAAEQPHRAAVVYRDQSVTYGQLQRATQRIGERLRNVGARPNTLVAVVMEKGWEQVAAVLGVIASGAAYLPLDPHLPQDRLWHLLRESQVEVVLTQPHVDGHIEWPEGVSRMQVNEALLADGDSPLLEPLQEPTDLAYVIYTSGSTGMPKGVMIDHRGALNTIVAINKRFSIAREDRVLALSSLSFDLSVYDIFGTLLAGGTIVLPDADGQRDPSHWADLIIRHNVTVWNSVPALMQLLMEYVAPRRESALQSLRLVLLSGDWIPVTLPDEIRKSAVDAQVISLGGATEASIWSVLYPIEKVLPNWKSVPYGRDLPNQQCYVLNQALEECPDWVPGELYIGGIGLARGYWHDEQRTRESFFSHPRTNQRLYRTGDFGRYLPDGNIEFLGREDKQVKVQGFRVDLGEIEAALAEHPALRTAVVVAHPGQKSDRRLAAFVVPHSGQTINSEHLREFLRRKLPDYVVPTSFVVLDELPLTSNGKVNRSALTPSMVDSKTCRPAQSIEDKWGQRVRKLVEGVMQLRDLASDANLIFHGATSMDIIRIVNRIDDEFGFRVKVDEIYQDPTLEGLVRRCRQYMSSMDPSGRTLLRDPVGFQRNERGLRDSRTNSVIDLPAVDLAHPCPTNEDQRRSHRHFLTDAISLDQLSRLLSVLRQTTVEGRPHYMYPSAGALYPVRSYVWAKAHRIDGLPQGLYIYQPVEHRLALLSLDAEVNRDLYGPLINAPIFDEAAFAIFFVGQLDAVRPRYGELARDFCLIEAGAMLQVLMMAAPECQIGICPIGSFDFQRLRPAFVLDSSDEMLFSLLAGRVDDAQSTSRLTLREPYRVDVANDEREEFDL